MYENSAVVPIVESGEATCLISMVPASMACVWKLGVPDRACKDGLQIACQVCVAQMTRMLTASDGHASLVAAHRYIPGCVPLFVSYGSVLLANDGWTRQVSPAF